MTTEVQKDKINKAIITPTNYGYLLIALLTPTIIIVFSWIYLTGIIRTFLLLACILIIALIATFVFFQKSRERAMRNVISHAIATDKKIITSWLSESFSTIESSDLKFSAKILQSKLDNLKKTEELNLEFLQGKGASPHT